MTRARQAHHRERDGVWDSYAEAVQLFLRGATLPTATRIALVVGVWLTVVNQGSDLLDGRIPWLQLTLNLLTPFTVSSLGFLAARRRRTVEQLAARLWPGPSSALDPGT